MGHPSLQQQSTWTICENLAILNWPLLEMSLWTMCLPGHIWLCWSYAGAPASHKTVPRTTNWRYINMLCSESFHMASSAAPVTASYLGETSWSTQQGDSKKVTLYLTAGIIIFDTLVPRAFQKYTTCMVFKAVQLFKKSATWFSENEGGGAKAVWNFSKNSSVLETPPVPFSLTLFLEIFIGILFHFCFFCGDIMNAFRQLILIHI